MPTEPTPAAVDARAAVAAALTATFTYQGFEIVPVIAGQVRSAASAVPFAIAGSLGMAGILYVLPRAVQPDSMGRSMTFFIWTILLLGGAATVFGPVLGSIIFWAVLALVKLTLRDVVPTTILRSEQIEQFGWIIVGVALMLLIIFRPQGILGDKKELAINAH